ncbi:hypothetical protein Tco_0833705 [Tanacetum coccineum]
MQEVTGSCMKREATNKDLKESRKAAILLDETLITQTTMLHQTSYLQEFMSPDFEHNMLLCGGIKPDLDTDESGIDFYNNLNVWKQKLEGISIQVQAHITGFCVPPSNNNTSITNEVFNNCSQAVNPAHKFPTASTQYNECLLYKY